MDPVPRHANCSRGYRTESTGNWIGPAKQRVARTDSQPVGRQRGTHRLEAVATLLSDARLGEASVRRVPEPYRTAASPRSIGGGDVPLSMFSKALKMFGTSHVSPLGWNGWSGLGLARGLWLRGGAGDPTDADSTMSEIIAPLTDLYAPVRAALDEAERVFDAELASDLPIVNELCGRVRLYRGKMMRPALLLLCGEATNSLTADHPTLAAVVEMVHMATLVHDDVLDLADERRREPTICSTEGNVGAVLLGDYLISHAFHLCSGLNDQHAARRVGATTNRVCEGELLQNSESGNDRLGEDQYLDIIERKTGALTAVACELGAWAAGGDDRTVSALASFGSSVGVAFQIVDDVLDIVGDRREMGKTLGIDLALGKLTLATIHCLRHADSATQHALGAAVRGEAAVDAGQLRGWLTETDSIDYALGVATEHVQHALRQLQLLPASNAKESLGALAEFIIHRRS